MIVADKKKNFHTSLLNFSFHSLSGAIPFSHAFSPHQSSAWLADKGREGREKGVKVRLLIDYTIASHNLAMKSIESIWNLV